METMHQLGRYEIVAELGRGAMGAVFRARDPKIDRTVAIKTIAVPAGAAKDFEHYRQRFFREAQAAGGCPIRESSPSMTLEKMKPRTRRSS